MLEADPARFDEVWTCLSHKDPLVRMRASDVLEKYTRGHPGILAAYNKDVSLRAVQDDLTEVRWHLFAMASRLPLNGHEARAFCGFLDQSLRRDDSHIVRVMALQAAWDISFHVPVAAGCRDAMIAYALSCDFPSVQARARRLLRQRGGEDEKDVLF